MLSRVLPVPACPCGAPQRTCWCGVRWPTCCPCCCSSWCVHPCQPAACQACPSAAAVCIWACMAGSSLLGWTSWLTAPLRAYSCAPPACLQPLDALGTVLEGGILGASDTGCGCHQQLAPRPDSPACARWGHGPCAAGGSVLVLCMAGLEPLSSPSPLQLPGRAHRRLLRHLPAGPGPLLLPARQPAVRVAGHEGAAGAAGAEPACLHAA